MNAALLLMCAAIAGADARETIPDVKSLSAIIKRNYAIDQIDNVNLAGDGSWLQASGPVEANQPFGRTIPLPTASYRRTLLVDKYQLWVAASPEHPNLLLAGYVRFDGEELTPFMRSRIEEASLETAFCVLIDVDRNVVVKLDESQKRLYLDDARHDALSDGIRSLWERYLSQIEAEPNSSPYVAPYLEFQQQFINPPPIKATVAARFTRSREDASHRYTGVYLSVTFAADGCEAKHVGTVDIGALLETQIAVPAVQYFTMPRDAEKEVE